MRADGSSTEMLISLPPPAGGGLARGSVSAGGAECTHTHTEAAAAASDHREALLLRHGEGSVRDAWVQLTAQHFGCVVLPLHDGKAGDLPKTESAEMRDARLRSLQQM